MSISVRLLDLMATQQVIADWLRREVIPGKVVEEPWRNFGYNRNYVLAELRKIRDVDYALMVDADEVVQVTGDPSALKQQLTEDCCRINMRSYRHEAELFEDMLSGRPRMERVRYAFCWRDCREPRCALQAYWKRVDLGGWQEEVYVSLLNAAPAGATGRPLS